LQPRTFIAVSVKSTCMLHRKMEHRCKGSLPDRALLAWQQKVGCRRLLLAEQLLLPARHQLPSLTFH